MTQWGKRADMVVHESDPFNAEPPPGALAGAMLTGLDSFYSRNHGPIPDLDAKTWELVVDGLVDTPLNLSLGQLRDNFVEQTLTATMQCAGNLRAGFLKVRDIPGGPLGAGRHLDRRVDRGGVGRRAGRRRSPARSRSHRVRGPGRVPTGHPTRSLWRVDPGGEGAGR